MPRPTWTGTISFGMVAIPVRLYVAADSQDVSFRMLCPNDLTPISMKRWCPTEDKEIPWKDTVRGFKVAPDEYVPLEDGDMEQLPLQTRESIDILEFCEDDEIDAGVYVEKAYYLEPERTGVKSYFLLREALQQTGRVAVGKFAMRDREHLCRIALHGDGLLLNTLHWPEEIRDAAELNIDESKADIHKRELAMAVMLIENLTAPFEPENYRDEYRDAVEELVDAKIHHKKLKKAKKAPEPTNVTDLTEILQASMEQAQKTAARKQKTKRPAQRERRAS